MKISFFANAFVEIPKVKELSWAEFAQKMGPHDYSFPSKEEAPAFSPAEFKPGSKTRTDVNVLQVWMFVIDLDHATEERFSAVIELVAQRGLAAVVYTTWRHAEDPWRARICIPLSRPVPARDWRRFWKRANTAFLNACDSKCKNPSRIFFGAFAPAGTEEQNFYEVLEGKPLDVDEIEAGESPTDADDDDELVVTGTEVLSRERLERFAKRMAKKTDDHSSDVGMRLLKVVKGDPFAEPGERDNVIFKLANSLARQFPNCDPSSVGNLFMPSLQLMSQVAPECPSASDVAKKFARAQAALQVCSLTEEDKAFIRMAFKNGREEPYSPEELKTFGDMSHQWIIQHGKSFYVFFNGNYRLYSESDVLSAVVRDLAPAKSAGVELFTFDKNNVPVQKSSRRLVQEYGCVALQVEVDLRAQASFYNNQADTMVEAPCPMRTDVTPRFHQEIDTWLRKINQEKCELILDWLVWLFELNFPCVALFLVGPKGVGKSLLGVMAASPWNTPPTPLEEVFSSFNSALAKNPVCIADEHLPKDNRGRARNQDLRFHIQARERQLRRKFMPNAILRGATRTLVVANNMEVLATSESLSVEDIEAIGVRYLYIEAQKEAADYLEKVGADRVREWVEKDMLVEHLYWLRENRQVSSRGRFLMDPSPEIQNTLLTHSGPPQALCQWCAGYLSHRKMFDDDPGTNRTAFIENGEFYVNIQAPVRFWNMFVSTEKCPPAGVISRALKAISHPKRLRYRDGKGDWMKYYRIDLDKLLAWIDNNGWLDEEQLVKVLSEDTEVHTLRKNK